MSAISLALGVLEHVTAGWPLFEVRSFRDTCLAVRLASVHTQSTILYKLRGKIIQRKG